MKTLIQENPTISISGQRYKRIDYDYDLISGKVNAVKYQDGQPDALFHHYEYDADNRITNVYSSKYPNAKWTGIQSDPLWEQDAKCFYYLHGTLARIELGDEKVQAIDYAYTIQGWIKAVNSETLLANRDMGKDGETSTNNVNKNIARDAFGYSLGYFNGDYKPIGTIAAIDNFIADKTGSDLMASRNDLFNGNISSMITTITNLSGTALPNAMAYKYDQLNRIKEAKGFTNIDAVNNTWQGGSTYNGRYYNNYSFDANGNILTALVKNDAGTIIDDQTYNYQTVSGARVNNKLYTITDNAIITAGYDLPSTQSAFNNTLSTINTANNYGYSEIGEMTFDKQDNITDIKRRVDGNITEITRTTGSGKTNLKFNYDAFGKRIAKHKYTNAGVWFESEYYVRDASGNIMSAYKYTIDNQTQTASFKQTERYIYGNSLLGIDKTTTELIGAVPSSTSFSRVLGRKQYSLQNHLGNDFVVVSDRKIPNDVTSDGVVDFYTADILLARDYGVFGEYLTNRVFTPNAFPNSFNGKRDDEEVDGWQDFDARNYLKFRRGWDRPDPQASKYPYSSPYVAFGNNPIYYVDPGGETLKVAIADQAKFMEDATAVFGEDATNLFTFDDCNTLTLTKAGQIMAFSQEQLGTNKGQVMNGLVKVVNSEEVTEVHYVESGKPAVENPEIGGRIATESGQKVNTAIDSYGGEMTFTKTDIKSNKIKDMENNHIFISKDKVQNTYGDKRENSLFHAIGHILFQKNSEQEKVIGFDNKARRESGDKERPVDPSHTNTPDPK